MGGSGRSLSMRGSFGLNGFESMREPFGLNRFECSWVFLGAPGVLLDAPGELRDAPGGLLGVRGCSWYSWGAPGCSRGAPGTSWGASVSVGIQFAYSHPLRKMGPKSGPSESLTPFRLNGFECSWVLVGAPGYFWVLLGCSWVFVGAPGVLLGAPGDPCKRRRVVTRQKVQ